MNVMIMAVYERIREIGTIAAIGTLPGKILSMFVVEGFCLGAIGAVAGNILSAIIMFIINHSGMTFNFGRQTLVVSAAIAPAEFLIVSGIVILISVIASFQPALKASRMEPIKALRHV
jgi:putative ABC transport system permease protein